MLSPSLVLSLWFRRAVRRGVQAAVYLPPGPRSVKFQTQTATSAEIPRAFEPLESSHFGATGRQSVFYIGGSVRCLEWCPSLHSAATPTDYLAVASAPVACRRRRRRRRWSPPLRRHRSATTVALEPKIRVAARARLPVRVGGRAQHQYCPSTSLVLP